ncbi:MAG: DM13 domain-containing protein [Pseudomonadota bacterium]
MTRFFWLAAFACISAWTAGAGPTLAADDMAIIKSGSFEGRSNHIAMGTVTLQSISGSWVLVLEDDFNFDGAPDPRLAFGDGDYVPSTLFTPLRANSGIQDYLIPDHIDPSTYSQVWLWCEQFSVPLGVAEIAPVE